MNPVVLFVDDDQLILSAFIRSFNKKPVDVFTARSAEEAMGILKRTRVDVVVTDERMKGIKGTELLLWASAYFPRTPGIVLTGQPDIPSMARAINDARVYRYLTKPVNAEDLFATIIQALKKRTSHRSIKTGIK